MTLSGRIAVPPDTSKKTRAGKLLEEAIRSHRFPPGSKLPGERKLSEMIGVSYMTVRKAVDELVARKWLERRPREGTYLCDAVFRVAGNVVNLICDAYDSYYVRDFTRRGRQLFEAAGFSVRVVCGYQNLQLGSVLNDGSMSVFMRLPQAYPELMQAVRTSPSRILVLGERVDDWGCPCVIADERQIVESAMTYLRRNGLNRIGIICCSMDNSVERERYAKWQELNRQYYGMTGDWEQRFFYLNLPYGAHPLEPVREWFGSYRTAAEMGVEALICPEEETALAILSVLREQGIECPRDISIIAVGNNELSQMSNPRLTCVDNGFLEHLEFAVKWAENVRDDRPDTTLLHLCGCRIIERESVRVTTLAGKQRQPDSVAG